MTTVSSRPRPAARRRARALIVVGWRLLLPVLCLLTVLLVPSDGYLGPARATLVLNEATGNLGFRLGAWEVQALRQKAQDLLVRPGADLTVTQQHDLVIAYFAALRRTEYLNSEIKRIYADPEERDPAVATAALQAELEAIRGQQALRRPAVESILEQQVATMLATVGLTTAGHVWPPVRFEFSESPDYLVVSPRNRIALEYGVYLEPTLSVSQMEGIEGQVQQDLDVSALVEGTGGFSSYPTMVIAHPDLEWVLSTIAHEWTHTYLAFRPLGWSYNRSGSNRTLNETTASIIGDELGRLVLERFYPELVPPADWPRPLSMQADWWQPKADARSFKFGDFMRETRLQVDKLLAAGQITQAENYMEARRKILVAQGYMIRKLNQAYFAFHGSYAVGPSATDPIGGKLRLLRRRTGTLAEFMQTVSRITSVAELDAALKQQRPDGLAAPTRSY
jgi:hypothetical protein